MDVPLSESADTRIDSMNSSRGAVRRRSDAEETRRRVLDAVVATVIDIGYYKTSSNEIARRAGVTWGSIQHLFGSREQLMLDVVNDIGSGMEAEFRGAAIAGDTLEERLASVLAVLAGHYEQDRYLVQILILLELSANPKMSALGGRVMDGQGSEGFDRLAQPLFAQAIGEDAADHDLVLYAFLTFRGYLTSSGISRRMAALPEGAFVRLMGKSQAISEPALRELVVRGVATTIREEAKRRGHEIR
jgi:AcrR family transcriptional regulator